MIGYISKNTLIENLKKGLLLCLNVQCVGYGYLKKIIGCVQCEIDNNTSLIAFCDQELATDIYKRIGVAQFVIDQHDDSVSLSLNKIIELMQDNDINTIAVFVDKFSQHTFSIQELRAIDKYIEKPTSSIDRNIEIGISKDDELKRARQHKNQKQEFFMKAFDLFWNVEEYNMWEIDECCTLAYVIDKLYKMINGENVCNAVLSEWMSLIQDKKIADLSVSVANRAMIAIVVDVDIEKEDKLHVTKQLDEIRRLRDQSVVSSFGMIGLKYAPQWFIEIKDSIFDQKREELKKRFFDTACNDHILGAQLIYDTLYQQNRSLLLELDHYLRYGKFKDREIATYTNSIGRIVTAKQLHEKSPASQSIIVTYYQFHQMKNI